jgi:glycine betaine/proline transport system substrate-binding protein
VLPRKKFGRLASLVALVASVALVATACGGRDASTNTGQQKKAITIGYIAWDEDIALSNLYKVELEQKGYTVKLQQLDAGPTYQGLSQGSLDLFLDAWLPATHEKYWAQYKDKLEDLGVWYDNATLNLAVPNYVGNVNSIADLKANAGMFGGKITGIEPSAGETRIIQENAIPQYELTGAMQLQNSSTTAMLAALEGAIKDQKPIVVALWHPHWAYSRFPIKDLADPKGAMGKGEQLHAIGRTGFGKDFPALAQVAQKFKLNDQQLGSLEDAIQKAGTGKEADAAKQWADQNKALVDQAFAGV